MLSILALHSESLNPNGTIRMQSYLMERKASINGRRLPCQSLLDPLRPSRVDGQRHRVCPLVLVSPMISAGMGQRVSRKGVSARGELRLFERAPPRLEARKKFAERVALLGLDVAVLDLLILFYTTREGTKPAELRVRLLDLSVPWVPTECLLVETYDLVRGNL